MTQTQQLYQSNQKIKTLIKLGNSKLLYKILIKWSINKLKCLLTTQIPSLSFDEFEICFKGQLLRGNEKLADILKWNENSQQIQMEIIKTKSHMKLKNYYKQGMGNFMKMSNYSSQPILCTNYQKYKSLISSQSTQNQPNQNPIQNLNIQQFDREINEPQNPIHPLLRLLKLLGIYLILVLIYDHGKAHQIAIIVTIVSIYYGIQVYVKYRQRKIKNNNRRNAQNRQNAANNPVQNRQVNIEEQQNEPNIWKGIILLKIYKFIEIMYCFIFTFFPNLTIQIHLQINKERIQRAKQQINQLIPNSFPIQNQTFPIQNQIVQNI